ICVHFAMLENTMDRTIWALLGLDRKAGRLITKGMMMRARIKKIRKEYVARFGEKSQAGKAYKQATDHADFVAECRNRYVHGLWGRRNVAGFRRKQFVLSYFKSHEGTDYEVVESEMEQLVVAIDAVTSEYGWCCHRYL